MILPSTKPLKLDALNFCLGDSALITVPDLVETSNMLYGERTVPSFAILTQTIRRMKLPFKLEKQKMSLERSNSGIIPRGGARPMLAFCPQPVVCTALFYGDDNNSDRRIFGWLGEVRQLSLFRSQIKSVC